jgi:hypothetical protein
MRPSFFSLTLSIREEALLLVSTFASVDKWLIALKFSSFSLSLASFSETERERMREGGRDREREISAKNIGNFGKHVGSLHYKYFYSSKYSILQ